MLRVVPLTLSQANELIEGLHRHHKPVVGHRFSIGAMDGERVCGAAVIGRPVARRTEQYEIAEVTRLVTDGTRNAEFEAWSAGGDWNKPSRGGRRTDQPMERKQRWGKTLNP